MKKVPCLGVHFVGREEMDHCGIRMESEAKVGL